MLYDHECCSAAERSLIASDGPVNVSANGEYETPHGASPTAAHTYYWVATYSGDANNKEAVSGCRSEERRVGKDSRSSETTQNQKTSIVAATCKDQAHMPSA